MTCRGNQVQFDTPTWVGLASLFLSLAIAIVGCFWWMNASTVDRVNKLETNGERQAQAIHDLALAVTRLTTKLDAYDERARQ